MGDNEGVYKVVSVAKVVSTLFFGVCLFVCLFVCFCLVFFCFLTFRVHTKIGVLCHWRYVSSRLTEGNDTNGGAKWADSVRTSYFLYLRRQSPVSFQVQ